MVLMSDYLRLRSIATVCAIFVSILFVGSAMDRPHMHSFISYFEKIDFGNGYIRITNDPSGWIIKLWLKNSGSKSATLTSVYLNEVLVPDSNYGTSQIVQGEVHTSIPDRINGLKIKAGQTEVISIYVSDSNYSDNSRIEMNIRLNSANG